MRTGDLVEHTFILNGILYDGLTAFTVLSANTDITAIYITYTRNIHNVSIPVLHLCYVYGCYIRRLLSYLF